MTPPMIGTVDECFPEEVSWLAKVDVGDSEEETTPAGIGAVVEEGRTDNGVIVLIMDGEVDRPGLGMRLLGEFTQVSSGPAITGTGASNVKDGGPEGQIKLLNDKFHAPDANSSVGSADRVYVKLTFSPVRKKQTDRNEDESALWSKE